MEDSELQSLMSVAWPPDDEEGEAVPGYLAAAVRALGGRADADLARTIGVAPSVIANWKRRRRIPEDYRPWFATTLVEKIATYNSELPRVGPIAREALIRVLLQTNGNPLGVETNELEVTADVLGALLALAQFIVDASDAYGLGGMTNPDSVAEAVQRLAVDFKGRTRWR